MEDPRSPRVKAAEDTILKLHYEIERLRATLANISYHYANQDMGHQAFRVYAKKAADSALEGNGVNN